MKSSWVVLLYWCLDVWNNDSGLNLIRGAYTIYFDIWYNANSGKQTKNDDGTPKWGLQKEIGKTFTELKFNF